MPADIATGAVQGSAPDWMPVSIAKDAPTNGSTELTPPAAELQWTPEPVEPPDAIVVDELESQLLATDVERATERRDYRERTMASPSLEVATPLQTQLPDPPAAPTKPDDPPVKVIASGTASTNERTQNGHAEGNRNGNGSSNGSSNGNGHANGTNKVNGASNGNGHANRERGEGSEIETDEDLVGFAHFPDATASPKIRWR